eukprot:COSAG01_NODE_49643_length_370_cov_1.121771_1_plen_26_part_10
MGGGEIQLILQSRGELARPSGVREGA